MMWHTLFGLFDSSRLFIFNVFVLLDGSLCSQLVWVLIFLRVTLLLRRGCSKDLLARFPTSTSFFFGLVLFLMPLPSCSRLVVGVEFILALVSDLFPVSSCKLLSSFLARIL
uniref:Uncharacterized protein n=1 Tax=Cacopsylla melanoneura TaxID=428564 RepID=A0A8D9BT49_9HEMI